MDIGSIFLLLALVTLVVFYLSQPFLNQRPALVRRSRKPGQQTALLNTEHEHVLQALQELDFDYSLGKVPEEDYPVQRSQLLQRGAEVLQKLDALQPAGIQTDASASPRKAADRLEESLAARREAASPAPSGSQAPQQNDDIEALIASRRRARNGSAPREKSIGFCPRCGKSIQKSDRFCPKCGMELS